MNTKRNLEGLLQTNRESIADFDYYFDWEKISRKLPPEKIEKLILLSTLIGSEKIEEDFRNLVNNNPDVLRIIPDLYCVNNSNKIIPVKIGNTYRKFDFNIKKTSSGKWILPMSVDDYVMFMRYSGIFREVLQNPLLKNPLLSYFLGLNPELIQTLERIVAGI